MEILEEALNKLFTNSPTAITEATNVIEAVQNQENGILLLLHLIQSTQSIQTRKSAIANLLRFVQNSYHKASPETQEESRILIMQIIQINLTQEEMDMMASVTSIIFKAMGFWKDIIQYICIAYNNQNYQLTMLFLSKIFPIIPLQVINQFYMAFKNMALNGLCVNDSNTFKHAVEILLKIGKKFNDISILDPLLHVLVEKLATPQRQMSQEFLELWKFTKQAMNINDPENEIIVNLYQIAMQYISNNEFDVHSRRLILDSFEPVVPIIPTDMLVDILNNSFILAFTEILTEDDLPDDSFSVLGKALISANSDQISLFVKSKVIENLNNANSLPHIVLGLCIMKPLLQYAQTSMINELDLILKSLQFALVSNQILIQKAALNAINIFDESFDGLNEISFPLMQVIMPLLIANDSSIRSMASNAFLSLCTSCDSEIEGLFNALWQLNEKNLIPADSIDNYILIVAKVLTLSQDIDDDIQTKVINYIENIFASPDQANEKAVSLSVLSSLFDKNSNLMNEILPKIIPVLNLLLNYPNEDAVCQALTFVTNLVKSYRNDALQFLQQTNYFEYIMTIITQNDEGRLFMAALNTASTIIKFCKENTLVPSITQKIIFLLHDSDEMTVIDLCNYVSMIARQLVTIPLENLENAQLTIYATLISIAKERSDHDLICAGFEALSKMFKRCRELNVEFFDNNSNSLISAIFSGNIKLLGGNPEKLFDVTSEIAMYLLSFIEVYLRTQPPNANEIYSILLKWATIAKDEIIIVPIIGAISETLRRANIDIQVLSNVVQYLQSIAPNVQNVQLRQNIAYFLSTFVSKFHDQVPLISQFAPIMDQWWEEGKTKTIGYQTCFSNIAVLYLHLFSKGGQISSQKAGEAIAKFPPADETETENMAILILQILSTQQNTELYMSSCISIANLLTKPQSSLNLKKLSQETFVKLQEVFKQIVSGNDDIKTHLLQMYAKNQAKQQTISLYF